MKKLEVIVRATLVCGFAVAAFGYGLSLLGIINPYALSIFGTVVVPAAFWGGLAEFIAMIVFAVMSFMLLQQGLKEAED